MQQREKVKHLQVSTWGFLKMIIIETSNETMRHYWVLLTAPTDGDRKLPALKSTSWNYVVKLYIDRKWWSIQYYWIIADI